MASGSDDFDMSSFTTDLLSCVFRNYITSGQLELPVSLVEGTISQKYGFQYPATRSIADYLIFVCNALRAIYQPVYIRGFPALIQNEGMFMKYVLTCCEQLMSTRWDEATYMVAELEDCQMLHFFTSTAFIAEFNMYCFGRGCFRYACTAKSCMLALHRRFFQQRLYSVNDLDAFELFCNLKLGANAEAGPDLLNQFKQVTLHGDAHLYNAVIGSPVHRCLQAEFDYIWNFKLSKEEFNSLLRGHCDEKEKEIANLIPCMCRFCGYACLTHLRRLLLFDVARP